MIELDIEPRRTAILPDPDSPSNYLVLGDFGGRSTIPLAIDRDNFSEVLGRLNVTLGGTAVRDLDDFHPDQLFHHRLCHIQRFARRSLCAASIQAPHRASR